MKKHVNLWLVMFLAISLALPIYSMAQTTPTLTLESYTTGDRISGGPIKTFSMGPDGSLVVYLDGPFTFAALDPLIQIDGTLDSYSGCNVSPPASVTAPKDATLFFTVKKPSGATFSAMPVDPDSGHTNFNTQTGRFDWNTSGLQEGAYLAVFQAAIGPQTPTQLVVMIKMNPPETVSTPAVSGPAAAGTVNQSYTFTVTTPSTVTPSGDPVQYSFDWGDGSTPVWLSTGVTSASKSWNATGNYSVKVQARCATHPSVVSAWSGTSSITISNVPPQTYTLTVNVNPSSGGGSVSLNPSGGPYNAGTPVTLTANPNSSAGYTFNASTGWSGLQSGETPTGNSVTITMNGLRTIGVTFTSSTPTPPSGTPLSWNARISANIPGGTELVYIANIDTNDKVYMRVDLTAVTNETLANITWILPDGTEFSGRIEGTSIGAGIGLMSKKYYWPQYANINSDYIPSGYHVLRIKAIASSNLVIRTVLY